MLAFKVACRATQSLLYDSSGFEATSRSAVHCVESIGALRAATIGARASCQARADITLSIDATHAQLINLVASCNPVFKESEI